MRTVTEVRGIDGAFYQEMLDDLMTTDRALAVVAGAVFDDQLKSLLQAYLRPPRKPGDDRLLGRSGPLDSFGPRIELARRLHLIPDQCAAALEVVRSVRNLAAHEAKFSFE